MSTEFLNTENCQLQQFLDFENEKYKSKDAIDDTVSDLPGNILIKVQLVNMGINVATIPYEWQNLKSKLCLWVNRNKNLFPPKSWYEIGEKVNNLGFNNLFHLVDFLLCHSMRSAEAERAFSSMKNIKTDKRTKLNNKLLTMQL